MDRHRSTGVRLSEISSENVHGNVENGERIVLRISDLFTGENKISERGNTEQTASAEISRVSAEAARQIRALTPGQLLTGELVSRNGSDVQIRVFGDAVLNAKVEQNVQLALGKLLTFEVKNNKDALTLRPLFINTAGEATVLKALDMASLPVNAQTVNMTRLMMDGGLSVDRDALQQMYREINANAPEQIQDLVNLHRLGLPVTQQNLTQAGMYRNLTHQLNSGMKEIFSALPNLVEEMLFGEKEDVGGVLKLYQGILQPDGENDVITTTADRDIVSRLIRQFADLLTADEADTNPSIPGDKNALLRQLIQDLEGLLQEENRGNLSGSESDVDRSVPGNRAVTFPDPQTQTLSPKIRQGIRELLRDPDLQRLVNGQLQKQWMISPEETADAGKVEELYKRLEKQLKGLSQLLEDVGQPQHSAARAVDNMRQNLDFMQQINQNYVYLQLPLKLSRGEAHGDLYVYTNKRNLAQSEGNISALLHLDMEHLGPVDVYVAMQNQKVNTKFYVADDEMLDYLYEHMDILTKRLENRGYHCDFSMQLRGEKADDESVIDRILKREGAQPLAQYGFDVRA